MKPIEIQTPRAVIHDIQKEKDRLFSGYLLDLLETQWPRDHRDKPQNCQRAEAMNQVVIDTNHCLE